jgi:hypothetical protein
MRYREFNVPVRVVCGRCNPVTACPERKLMTALKNYIFLEIFGLCIKCRYTPFGYTILLKKVGIFISSPVIRMIRESEYASALISSHYRGITAHEYIPVFAKLKLIARIHY